MGGGEGEAGGEPAGAAPAAAAPATLHIRGTSGNKFAVRADLGATVGEFKAAVAESCDVPAPQQRLIYKGRILKDDQTLASYGACVCSLPPSLRSLGFGATSCSLFCVADDVVSWVRCLRCVGLPMVVPLCWMQCLPYLFC